MVFMVAFRQLTMLNYTHLSDLRLRNKNRFASSFLLLFASILCIFFLFSSAGVLLGHLFPSPFPEGTEPQTRLFRLILKAKVTGLLLLSLVFFVWLAAISKKGKRDSFSFKESRPFPVHFWPWGALFVFLSGFLSASSIFTSPTGGDEGMWTNVVRNIILYSHYALGQPGSFQDFSPLITVGPLVILPLSLLYQWIPAGLGVCRAYASFWFLAAFTMLYFFYVRMLSRHQLSFGLILALIFLHNPGIRSGYSSVMGEMPALFFLLAGLFFLPSSPKGRKNAGKLFLSGFFLGIAMLAKLTLTISLIALPLVLTLYGFSTHKGVGSKPCLVFLAGILLPMLPWLIVTRSFTNIPAQYNLHFLSEFLLFGIRNLGGAIGRYGVENFIKLGLLAVTSTLFIRRALQTNQSTFVEWASYVFSIFFILWFFFCTDGHFVRYLTYPVFLLIPLAIKALPEKWPPATVRKALLASALPFFLLFHEEMAHLGRAVLLKRNSDLPWISEQLKEKWGEVPGGGPTVWTLDEFDGYFLSILTRPPVFWVREEMFYKTPRGFRPLRELNQINMGVPRKSERDPFLPPLRKGDLVALGVSRGQGQERKLYLMKITRVPKEKVNRFFVSGDLPEELERTLRNDFESLGITSSFMKSEGVPDENAYGLELTLS